MMKLYRVIALLAVLLIISTKSYGADLEHDIKRYGPTLSGYVEYVEDIADAEMQANALSYLQGLRHMWVFTFASDGYTEAQELDADITYDEMLVVAAQCVDETPDLVLYQDLLSEEMKPSQQDEFLVVAVHDILLENCRTWLRTQESM